jgi:hypothetical protein
MLTLRSVSSRWRDSAVAVGCVGDSPTAGLSRGLWIPAVAAVAAVAAAAAAAATAATAGTTAAAAMSVRNASLPASPASSSPRAVVACLRSHHAYLQSDPRPLGTPPAVKILEFTFATYPAPLTADHGPIIFVSSQRNAQRWYAYLAKQSLRPTIRGNAVVAWDNGGRGHEKSRRIVLSCLDP